MMFSLYPRPIVMQVLRHNKQVKNVTQKKVRLAYRIANHRALFLLFDLF